MLLKVYHYVGVTPWLRMGWCLEAGKYLHVWMWKLVSWIPRDIVKRRTLNSRFVDTLSVPTWWTKWLWSHMQWPMLSCFAPEYSHYSCVLSFQCTELIERNDSISFITQSVESGIYEKGYLIIHCLSPRYIPFIFQSNVPFSPFPWEETVRSYQHWGQFLLDILSQ